MCRNIWCDVFLCLRDLWVGSKQDLSTIRFLLFGLAGQNLSRQASILFSLVSALSSNTALLHDAAAYFGPGQAQLQDMSNPAFNQIKRTIHVIIY